MREFKNIYFANNDLEFELEAVLYFIFKKNPKVNYIKYRKECLYIQY